jgi:hypothetical protein
MSDYDLCLTGVLIRPILLYNAQRDKIALAGGMNYAYRSHGLNTYATTIVALGIGMNALVLVGNISYTKDI